MCICVNMEMVEIIKICKLCGKEFESKSSNRKYCSKECRVNSMRNSFKEDYNIYKNGFNEVNSYIYGLILADGCLIYDRHTKRYRITIVSKDYDILEKLKEYMGIRRKIYNQNGCYSIIYINEDAIKFLIDNGLKEQKSLDMKFPNIPNKYLWHFIRGYFDGDGSISIRKMKRYEYMRVSFTCGSIEFINELNYILNQNKIHSNIYNESKNREKSNTKYLIISRQNDIIKFYNLIYNNCEEYYLDRKKSKFII